MIIGLIGKARSGKTTVAQEYVNKFGFREVSFAKALKEMIINSLLRSPPPGLDGKPAKVTYDELYQDFYVHRSPQTRWLLQFVGTLVRDADEDYWVKQAPLSHFADVVVADVRFPNEVKAIKDKGGIIIRLIHKSGGKIEYGANHISETALDGYNADYTIEAEDGVDNLLLLADNLMNQIRGDKVNALESAGRETPYAEGVKPEEKPPVESRSQ